MPQWNDIPDFKDGLFQAAPNFGSYSTPNDSSFFGTPHFNGSNAAQAGINALGNAFPGIGILAGLGQGFNMFGQAPGTGNKFTDIAGTAGPIQTGAANVGNWLNRLLGGTYMPDSYAAPTMGGPSQGGGQSWNDAVEAMRNGGAPMGSPDFSIPQPQMVQDRNPSFPDFGPITAPPMQDFNQPQVQAPNIPAYTPTGPISDPSFPDLSQIQPQAEPSGGSGSFQTSYADPNSFGSIGSFLDTFMNGAAFGGPGWGWGSTSGGGGIDDAALRAGSAGNGRWAS